MSYEETNCFITKGKLEKRLEGRKVVLLLENLESHPRCH